MKWTAFSQVILGFLLSGGGSLLASDVDEIRERAKALQSKAAILLEQGNKEQARRIEKESEELLEKAEQLESRSNGRVGKEAGLGIDREVLQLKDRLQDLLAKERSMREDKATESELGKIRGEIADIERALHKVQFQHAGKLEHRPEFRAQIEKLERAGQRVHHLRVAAQHLKFAEEHDLARKLMEQAEVKERDMHAAKQRLASEMQSDVGHNIAIRSELVTQIKEENERLRVELREIKKNLDKRQ